MRNIASKTANIAFDRQEVKNVVIVGVSLKEWRLEFTALDPVLEKEVTYGLLTRRGQTRTWADPRRLMRFLSDRGVRHGEFRLEEGFFHEDDESTTDGDEGSD